MKDKLIVLLLILSLNCIDSILYLWKLFVSVTFILGLTWSLLQHLFVVLTYVNSSWHMTSPVIVAWTWQGSIWLFCVFENQVQLPVVSPYESNCNSLQSLSTDRKINFETLLWTQLIYSIIHNIISYYRGVASKQYKLLQN